MPPWSEMIDTGPSVGSKAGEIEQFAAKLEAMRPSPGNVSMETSLMLDILSCGDDKVLEKLRVSLLRSDLGSMVKVLEDANRHDEADLHLLRKSYEEDDKIAITHALRRLTGDRQAGREDDEFKPFDGKGFVRRDAEGQLERLPFVEEQMSGGNLYDITCCWHASLKHNSTHIVPPALMPKNVTDTRVYTVMSIGAEYDWEQLHGFNVIEENIANATGDLLTGIMNPDSGSMVMSQFDPTIPQDIKLG